MQWCMDIGLLFSTRLFWLYLEATLHPCMSVDFWITPLGRYTGVYIYLSDTINKWKMHTLSRMERFCLLFRPSNLAQNDRAQKSPQMLTCSVAVWRAGAPRICLKKYGLSLIGKDEAISSTTEFLWTSQTYIQDVPKKSFPCLKGHFGGNLGTLGANLGQLAERLILSCF